MSKISDVLNEFNSNSMFEMTNLKPKDTGIPNGYVYISSKFFGGKIINHGARLKYFPNNYSDGSVVISISDKPEILEGNIKIKNLKTIFKWITLNKDVLLEFWNDDSISTIELLNKIQKI